MTEGLPYLPQKDYMITFTKANPITRSYSEGQATYLIDAVINVNGDDSFCNRWRTKYSFLKNQFDELLKKYVSLFRVVAWVDEEPYPITVLENPNLPLFGNMDLLISEPKSPRLINLTPKEKKSAI